jgi:hypothetical protein
MADVFTYSRSGASPQEKADYVKKNIRRFEFHVPK